MSSELVSLADASAMLDVSVERVRQLVVAGDLPARRFGNAWAVPVDAVLARRREVRSGGRPLGPARAWREIVDGEVDLAWPGRYRRRAEVMRFEMSDADADSLPSGLGALVGGVRAAIGLGASLIAGDERDVYVSRAGFARLDSVVAAVPAPFGRVRVRVVDDDVWGVLAGGEFAPPGAVALDLVESADPRHWVAAEGLVADV